MNKLSEQVEQLEKELKQSNREYEELRELYIADRWELNGFKEERDRAYDTINEYRVEAEDLRLLTDELIAERDREQDKAEDLSILIDELTAERGSAYLKRDIAEDKVEEVEQERDTLAYENRNLAEFIKYNDSILTDTDVGDIACGTPDVWDRFTNKGCKYLLSNNIEQRETIRELRRKITKIENICNDMDDIDWNW